MARVLVIIAMIALTVYAVSDWARTSEEDMPGRLPRMLWLIIIVMTTPTFALGSILWIIIRIVERAEKGEGASDPSGSIFDRFKQGSAPKEPPAPVAPDDDPDFLFKLERDIRRRRLEEKGEGADSSSSPISGDEGDSPDQPHDAHSDTDSAHGDALGNDDDTTDLSHYDDLADDLPEDDPDQDHNPKHDDDPRRDI